MLPYTDVLLAEAQKAGRPRPNYRRFPILDTRTISPEGYDEILAYIDSEIDAGRVVYVHCWGGKGRTCTVIGCRLIDGGLDYDATMTALNRLRAETKRPHTRSRTPRPNAACCATAPPATAVTAPRDRGPSGHALQRRGKPESLSVGFGNMSCGRLDGDPLLSRREVG